VSGAAPSASASASASATSAATGGGAGGTVGGGGLSLGLGAAGWVQAQASTQHNQKLQNAGYYYSTAASWAVKRKTVYTVRTPPHDCAPRNAVPCRAVPFRALLR
jgi:hypothetical protein